MNFQLPMGQARSVTAEKGFFKRLVELAKMGSD